jgi:hypothetical protein
MRVKKIGIAGISLCLCLGASVFAGLVDTEVGGMTDGQQLKAYFDGEQNGYRRLAYLKELGATLTRFKLSGNEQWVDQLLDKALDDATAIVVLAAVQNIGDLNKKEFIDRLITVYQAAPNGRVAFSQSAIRCMIVRTLKRFSDPRVVAFFTSIVQAPPQGETLSPVVSETIAAMAESGDRVYVQTIQTFSQTVQAKISAIKKDGDAYTATASAPQAKSDEQSVKAKKEKNQYWISRYTELASACDRIAKKLSDKQGGSK